MTLSHLRNLLTSSTTRRVIRYNFARLDNHKIFDNRLVRSSENPRPLPYAELSLAAAERVKTFPWGGMKYELEGFLRLTKAVAFIVIKDGAVAYEKYFRGYSADSFVNAFSITKSVVSALVGIAISEGYIRSVEQTVGEFLPELKGTAYERVSVHHLLQMTSGVHFSFNGCSPFSDNSQFYYAEDLREHVSRLRAETEQGRQWCYKESDPQVLAFILRRVTGHPLSKYLEEKIWKPLGMEFDAKWSLDSNESGIEKAFCCLNGRARDFARFGLLYLRKGDWGGRQIVPRGWVEASTRADVRDGGAPFYKYLWWLPLPFKGDFYACGNLGQYVYVNPEHNVVIAKFGESNFSGAFRPGAVSLFRHMARQLGGARLAG